MTSKASLAVALLRSVVRKSHFADVGQVAIALRKIDPVAHHEFIRDLEADPVSFEVDLSSCRFIKQGDGS